MMHEKIHFKFCYKDLWCTFNSKTILLIILTLTVVIMKKQGTVVLIPTTIKEGGGKMQVMDKVFDLFNEASIIKKKQSV